jgi:hypothetical protein
VRAIKFGPPHLRFIRTAFYNSATATWTAAGELSGGTEFVGEPQLAMDRGGHATVLWTRVRHGVESKRYSPGTGWGPIVALEVVDSGPSRPGVGDVLAEHPTLAVEGNGNAVAAWGVRDYGTGVVQQRSAFFVYADCRASASAKPTTSTMRSLLVVMSSRSAIIRNRVPSGVTS